MPSTISHKMQMFAFASVAIAVLALSIHTVMLQVLHVPYPDYSRVGLLGLLEPFGHFVALLVLYDLIASSVGKSFTLRWLALALADAMVAEKIRLDGVMFAVTTHSILFPAIHLSISLAETLVLALLLALMAPALRSLWAKLLGALGITAAQMFLFGPMQQYFEAMFTRFQRPEIYHEPYGMGVLAISYTTFMITVASVLVISTFLTPRLGKSPSINLALTMLLLLLLRGTLVAQVAFPWRMGAGVFHGAIDSSQFFLQDLVMVASCWGVGRLLARGERLIPQKVR